MLKKKRVSGDTIKTIFHSAWGIYKYVRKGRKYYLLASLICVGIYFVIPFATDGVNALLINHLTTLFGNGVFDSKLIWLVFASFFTILFRSVINQIVNHIELLNTYYFEELLTFDLLDKRTKIDVASHESPKTMNLEQKVRQATTRIPSFIDNQAWLMGSMVSTIVAAGILAYFNWVVFLIVLAGTLPNLYIKINYGKRVWSIWDAKAETHRKYDDILGHFRHLPALLELKIIQGTAKLKDSAKKLYHGFIDVEKKNETGRVRRELGATLLNQISVLLALFWFAREVVMGNMQIGTLIFVLGAISKMQNDLSNFFSMIGHQYERSLFIRDFLLYMAIEPKMFKHQNPTHLKPNKTPRIEFRNVWFKYPSSKKWVLENINFTINAGERFALVGVNGAGKTTLTKLICRFYDPTRGKILIDGIDLKNIEIESWYRMLGVLFQDYGQYHMRVKEGVGMGRSQNKLHMPKVKQASEESEANVFIEEWKKDYNQQLGKEFSSGIEPSVGQWQKLALARTFYRDPQVFILDEPTSSIDAEAEAKIFEKLENMRHDRTVILISHRFSTVRYADRIWVLKNNKVEELGPHEELLKNNGTYAHLFRLQAKGYQ